MTRPAGDAWCSLCEKPRGDTPDYQWWEVASLGPVRRVHGACLRSVIGVLNRLPHGELLRRTEAREVERGIVR